MNEGHFTVGLEETGYIEVAHQRFQDTVFSFQNQGVTSGYRDDLAVGTPENLPGQLGSRSANVS